MFLKDLCALQTLLVVIKSQTQMSGCVDAMKQLNLALQKEFEAQSHGKPDVFLMTFRFNHRHRLKRAKTTASEMSVVTNVSKNKLCSTVHWN